MLLFKGIAMADNSSAEKAFDLQSALDRMEAEAEITDKPKDKSGIEYLEQNYGLMNEEELNRHLQEIMGKESGEKDKAKKTSGETTGGDEDINKELEIFQRVQEEIQEEKKKDGSNVDPQLSKAVEEDTDKPPFSSTATTTYKGVSIPSNSELVKTKDSTVMKAYKELVGSSSALRKPVNVASAQLAALPLTITAPDKLSFNVQMLINTLPVLDNLATQVLRIIAQGPFPKVMELVSNRDSYSGISFGNLVELFETTKRVYNSEENPFFTVENVTFGQWKFGQSAPDFLKGREETIEGTLRKVNLATFLLATLGLIDLGFFFLNEAFLDVFCPPQNLDPSSSLSFLRQDSLQSMLPSPNGGGTVHSNTKFLKPQAILFLELKTQAFISAIELGDRSREEIIHDLFPDNMGEILYKRRNPSYDSSKTKVVANSAFFSPAELDFLARCDSRKKILLESTDDSKLMENYEWMKFLSDLLEYVSNNAGFLIWGPKGKISGQLDRYNVRDEDELKRKQIATAAPEVPLPDRKKQRHNRPSTFRRTWTEEEEDALREGLKLKGTHWTAILELYGAGGSVSEALKNRTSLQLKDKARNWKVSCLKNNQPVPDYLAKAAGGSIERAKQEAIAAGVANGIKRPKAGSRSINLHKKDQGADEAEEELQNLVAQAFTG